ncbi:MAG: riboflavin synthase [Legionellaceae bacterium]|nr:riboflavin synthase [Legionellaceae bacterium]
MFTGIVEQQARVSALRQTGRSAYLEIETVWTDLCPGESVAVNGVCLTALTEADENMRFDVSSETLAFTNLGQLQVGDLVNIERALQAKDRFGGHYVSGHVNCQAVVQDLLPDGDCAKMHIHQFTSKNTALYLMPKGSITIEGVSVTINEVGEDHITVMLVPHTLSLTTLGQLRCGRRVNVEFDYLTQIVAHQLSVSGHITK